MAESLLNHTPHAEVGQEEDAHARPVPLRSNGGGSAGAAAAATGGGAAGDAGAGAGGSPVASPIPRTQSEKNRGGHRKEMSMRTEAEEDMSSAGEPDDDDAADNDGGLSPGSARPLSSSSAGAALAMPLVDEDFKIPDPPPATVKLDARWHDNLEALNQYLILAHLGSGAYGDVSLGRLLDGAPDGPFFAIKCYSKNRLRRQRDIRRVGNRMVYTTALEKVTAEIGIMAQLHHPNLVSLIEVVDPPEQDPLLLVIEYVHGGCMAECDPKTRAVVDKFGSKLSAQWVQQILYDVAKGLHHRVDGVSKLADYGVAHQFKPGTANGRLTKTEGTWQFMAPEVCAGNEYNGYPADVWALGVTMYGYYFGKLPFGGESVPDIFAAIAKEDLTNFPGPIEKNARDLLLRMLDRDVAARITVPEILAHPYFAEMEVKPRLKRTVGAVTALPAPMPCVLPPRATSPVPPVKPSKEGWLFKRGRIFRTWHRRYFVLNNGTLQYFHHPGGPERGSMPCEELAEVRHAPKEEKDFRFYLRSGDRQLYLQAESAEDFADWFKLFTGLVPPPSS